MFFSSSEQLLTQLLNDVFSHHLLLSGLSSPVLLPLFVDRYVTKALLSCNVVNFPSFCYSSQVALVLGALCCNGIIEHCDQTAIYAAAAHSVTGNVISTLNGNTGQDKPFNRGESLLVDTDVSRTNKLFKHRSGIRLIVS